MNKEHAPYTLILFSLMYPFESCFKGAAPAHEYEYESVKIKQLVTVQSLLNCKALLIDCWKFHLSLYLGSGINYRRPPLQLSLTRHFDGSYQTCDRKRRRRRKRKSPGPCCNSYTAKTAVAVRTANVLFEEFEGPFSVMEGVFLKLQGA